MRRRIVPLAGRCRERVRGRLRPQLIEPSLAPRAVLPKGCSMRVAMIVITGLCAAAGAVAQERFAPPTIEGFNPASPSIVSGSGGAPRAVKPSVKSPSQKAKRSQSRRSEPTPGSLYGGDAAMNPLPGQITAPMPNPRDFKVPPSVPPASPLASPPPGQSCDPYGPGHCGMKWR